MLVIHSRHRIDGDLPGEISRLESLVVDLRYLASGYVPEERHLTAAPVLDNWEIVPRPISAVVGIMGGHPDVADRSLAITSPIEVYAPEYGWLRTGDRMYRLGQRAGFGPGHAN